MKWGWRIGVLLLLLAAALVWQRYRTRQVASKPMPPAGDEAAAEPPATVESPQAPEHPLDPALKIARDGLQRIRAEVRDYTATIHKRERIGRSLGTEQTMFAKIRNRKVKDGQTVVPLSAYLKFLAPSSVAGREVIWVEGRNDGKLIAHEGGLKNLIRATLPPNGFLAMLGNRYPITEIGIENLVVRLIEKGEQARLHEDVQVEIREDEKVAGRACRLIQVTHPERQPDFDFHIAQIFIDSELDLPLRYASYDWPEEEGGEPLLLEEYTYENLQPNVGLTDEDFDPDNKAYSYP